MSDALSDALAAVLDDVANGRQSPAVGTALAELHDRLRKVETARKPAQSKEN